METRRRRRPRLHDPFAPTYDALPPAEQAGGTPQPVSLPPPRPRVVRPAGQRHQRRLIVGAVAGGLVLLLAYAIGHGASSNNSSGSGSSSAAEWTLMAQQLGGHLNAWDDAQRAGNAQGAADRLTQIAGDCREARGYSTSGSHDEALVQFDCALAGFRLR